MTGPDELRLDIARAHGLPDDATLFLTGTTIDTLEHQAATLAKIIRAGNDEQPAPATNPFTQGPAGKAARQRNLLAALHAPPPQERDERGRYTSSGFDGGARQTVPAPRDPEADHNALLAQLAGIARMFSV